MIYRDFRLWCPAVAIALLMWAALNPQIKVQKDTYNLMIVIDITQSMNAQDYHVDNQPADRLSFVKAALKEVLAELPCDSKIGLGLFSTKNIFLLFEPLELCAHYAAIDESLAKIDWRMAWAADSHIARGIYTSLSDIQKLESKPGLVFFTDGQQTPKSAKEPFFQMEAGKTPGLIVGTGNLESVPVPRLDNQNQQIGFWQISEAEGRRRANTDITGNYLTAVQEPYLQRLAVITGLSYHHLEDADKLLSALKASSLLQKQPVNYPFAWMLAAVSLLLLLTPFAVNRLAQKP
ncbi:MAG: VWA domain-containing protein [Methylicorpusculum sp.]|uniref:VWA domain-containing protein n=1 Tax=Methylicorpusculum sp. TaxID=2713644 RepID=UPI00271A3E3F|nr:VWA domain-containing protein [Methylicorpusculum sp.]MDO8843762.1 VWA domain-containing protein [Methylicorpusculum sp.]MDO8939614.1 VWA domain-containing protein [Methylicorpusculum sp.]MDO9241408.1 VWA domain-containing protein [Methylicorpusculum sp.]MDP2180631.1 VWA domain-containing protein [Methylicorpusculum sp.]MDP2203672.1 VWA domain-containing protein [Methylicorpusculum sp.]